jgi:hypothetical protein
LSVQKYLGELVPLELLAWVLEPERLSLSVTGKPFVPFVSAGDARKQMLQKQEEASAAAKNTISTHLPPPSAEPIDEYAEDDDDESKYGDFEQEELKGGSSRVSFNLGNMESIKTPKKKALPSPSKDDPKVSLPTIKPLGRTKSSDSKGSASELKAYRRHMSTVFQQQEADAEVFGRKKQFTLYIIDQVNLLTEMCRGRCVNAIHQIETCFSYTLLMNMASNPWLPFRFRAAIVHLVLVLYVDRYPQLPKCGAAQLPEAIWIFEDDQAEVRRVPLLKL